VAQREDTRTGRLQDPLRAPTASEREELRTALGRQPALTAVRSYLAAAEDRLPREVEEEELVRRARAGDAAARERLIELLLPLVVRLARSYRVEGLETADLVQEGCLGVLRALARYEPERGVPFVAYATWWIRQALQEARSDFMRPLRIPPKALRQLARLKSEHDRLYALERRQPRLEEVAERAGIDPEQAEALLRADREVRSLAQPVVDEDGEIGLLGDLLEDPLSTHALEEVLDSIAGEQLRTLLGRLSEREREILVARFGLDGGPARRLGEVGAGYGISAERVRQLEERGLAKLRRAVLPEPSSGG
jgi:RNA polymerase primary sigma factor